MADEKNTSGENGASIPAFNLQRIYLKTSPLKFRTHLLFFLDNTSPKLEFQVDSNSQEIDNEMVEVSVTCSVTCRLGDKIGFLIEGCEAGIFEIKNVDDKQKELLKGITCPNIVYPYLRANIADALQRASFPPVHLTEINWELFYQEKLKKKTELT